MKRKNVIHLNHSGMSLIELMVAIAVSGIMLLGVGTIYNASQRSYQVNTELAGVQENARFALHTLTSSIRQAGYTGCLKGDDFFLAVHTDTPPDAFKEDPRPPAEQREIDGVVASVFNRNTYITGYTEGAIPFDLTPPNIATDSEYNRSDAILVRRASSCSATVISTNRGGKTMTVQGNCNFLKGDAVIVTTCGNNGNASLFTISNEPTGSTPTLSYDIPGGGARELSFDVGAKVMKATATMYYIGEDANLDRHLYSWFPGAPAPTLLVPNAEQMVITYGVDTNGDTTRSVDAQFTATGKYETTAISDADYQTAITAEEIEDTAILPAGPWSRVVQVTLRILLASEPIGTNIKEYSFDGNDFTKENGLATDTRSRREVITSINIRNRTL